MLKQLRGMKMAKWIWIILAAATICAFVLWGITDAVSNRQKQDVAGIIFGKRISLIDYRDAEAAVRDQMITHQFIAEQYKDDTSYMQKFSGPILPTWERLIALHEATRRRITAGDNEVVEAIENAPFFQKKGTFDKGTYLEILRYVFRTKERTFEEEVRQNLMIGKLYRAVSGNIALGDEDLKKNTARQMKS